VDATAENAAPWELELRAVEPRLRAFIGGRSAASARLPSLAVTLGESECALDYFVSR